MADTAASGVPFPGSRQAVTESRLPRYRTLPEKLDYLFATVRPPGQNREYTHEEIANLAKTAGESISATYVWSLRTDPTKNPTMRGLAALAAAFNVPAGYFFNDELSRQIEENLGLLAALRRDNVHQVAQAAAGLSDETLQSIMQMITRAREWEGLDAWDKGRIPSE